MRLDGFGLLVEDIMRSYTLKKGRHLMSAFFFVNPIHIVSRNWNNQKLPHFRGSF